jgi:membrane protein implicated in regulation of membrane protease activity
MSGLVRYLTLTAKAKTGFGPGILAGAIIAAALAIVAIVFFIVAMFFLLEAYVGPLQSALFMGGGFLLLAIIAAVVTISARRRAMERAEQALAARAKTTLFDSSVLTLGIQIGRIIGWRRLVPVAAVAVLAAAVAREWSRRNKTEDDDTTEGDK